MKYLIIFFIILGFAGCQRETIVFDRSEQIVQENQDLNDTQIDSNNLDDVSKENAKLEEKDNVRYGAGKNARTSDGIIVPDTFDLPVKFAPQAPFAVWDELHKEACEEAVMIIAAKYLKGEDLDKQIMEQEILALVKWEGENGYKIDVTAEETVQILMNYFGLRAEVTREVTVERIKRELALGNLVITPHAGRQLGNPYYRQPGPVYHFLVIRGWDEDEFITNDVGTKRGEGYRYKFDKIINTMHDWNEGDVENGQRVMIVVR